jgi:uncharacterized integral membrane protein (TIGR00698 family)
VFGVIVCLIVAITATALGNLVPVVGGPVFAIVIGAVIATAWRIPEAFRPGIAWCSKSLLQWSIVLLGASLSLAEIAAGGASTLPLMLITFGVVLVLAWFAGRALGLDADLRRLLGVGTAICGGSAIAAVSSVIEADQADIAYALGAVFLFNVIAVVVFPLLGHAMHLSQHAFGVWAGTAINDTSSVVAASLSYGRSAGSTGVIVKLTRTLLIIPLVLYYAWRRARVLRAEGKSVPWRAILPWFVLWFVVAAALNSLGLIPAPMQAPVHQLALFTIVVALAGVGLGTDVARIRSAGLRPLALGAVLWAAIAITSLCVARLLGIGQA